MDIFRRIPNYIKVDVLKEWLNLADICRFDTAFCSKEWRCKFWALFAYEGAWFTGFNEIPVGVSYIKWIRLRNIKVRTLSLKYKSNESDVNSGLPKVIRFKYLKHFEVHFDVEWHSAPFVVSLLLNCPQLESLTI